MITKQDAAILFAYSFKLVDKEGREHDIAGVNDVLMLKNNIWVEFNQIGTDYWILKRPYSQLEAVINHDEKKITPMDLFFIEYGGGVSDSAKRYWIEDFLENILCSPMEKLPYDIVIKLYSLHFIKLPEGTYREINE